jgi:hypothetical protein
LAGDCLRGLLFLREGGIQTSGTMNPSVKRKEDGELGLRIRSVGRRTWCWIRRCHRRRRWRPASCDGTRGLGCPRRPSRRGGRTPRPTWPADWGAARGAAADRDRARRVAQRRMGTGRGARRASEVGRTRVRARQSVTRSVLCCGPGSSKK